MAFFFVVPFRFAYFGLVGVGSFISDPCTPALNFPFILSKIVAMLHVLAMLICFLRLVAIVHITLLSDPCN